MLISQFSFKPRSGLLLSFLSTHIRRRHRTNMRSRPTTFQILRVAASIAAPAEEPVPIRRRPAMIPMGLGRPAAFVPGGNAEVCIGGVARRRRLAATFALLLLLFFLDLLHAALLRLAVCFLHEVDVEARGAVFEYVAHYVAGGHLVHAKGEVDVFAGCNGVTARARGGGGHAFTEDGGVAGCGGGGARAAGAAGGLVGNSCSCSSYAGGSVAAVGVGTVVVVAWRGLAGDGAVVVDVDGEVDVGALEVHARSFNANLLKGDHEHADEFVAALETQAFVLPVGFVEEDDVERDGKVVCDLAHFSEDVALEFTAFAADELDQALPQGVDLLEHRAVFDDNGDGFCQRAGPTLVENKQGVQVRVGRLDNVPFHLLEFRVEERDLLDEIVIS